MNRMCSIQSFLCSYWLKTVPFNNILFLNVPICSFPKLSVLQSFFADTCFCVQVILLSRQITIIDPAFPPSICVGKNLSHTFRSLSRVCIRHSFVRHINRLTLYANEQRRQKNNQLGKPSNLCQVSRRGKHGHVHQHMCNLPPLIGQERETEQGKRLGARDSLASFSSARAMRWSASRARRYSLWKLSRRIVISSFGYRRS